MLIENECKQSFEFLSGFTNTKRVDASSNMEFKAALDKALMEQMQKLSIKQKKAEKEQVANIYIPVIAFIFQL